MDSVIISGITDTYRTLADGRIKMSIIINPEHRVDVAREFGEVGTPIALARLDPKVDREVQLKKNASTYGQAAQELKQSGFFRSPNVWKAISSDAEFLAWIRLQECVAKHLGNCGGDVVAAHVRRIANGAGTGIKPEFSAIPLCDSHHKFQHNKGEPAFPGGKEWFDQQRIKYVEHWAWITLKKTLGYDSWANVPCEILFQWALKHDLVDSLPNSYKAN